MGNVNMEAYQIHTNDPTAPNVQKALDKLKSSETIIAEDIATLAESVAGKADRVNIAGTFSAETQYFVDDLVYHEDTLYKCTTAHLGEWDIGDFSATNVAAEIATAGGGYVKKQKRFTGTGTNPYTIDFGEDTPVIILGIIPDPDESLITSNFEFVGPIPWGNRLGPSYWSTQSGGDPTTSNGGTNVVRATYSGNTVTLAAGSATAASNAEGQKYIVEYLV